jgi:WD40 repeat protein
LLASGGWFDGNGGIVLQAARTGQETDRVRLDYAVADVVFGPDGETVIATDTNGTLWAWRSTGAGRELVAVADNRVRSSRLALSSDGTRLAVGTAQDRVVIWRVDGGLPVQVVAELDHEGDVDAIDIGGDDRVVAASAGAGTVSMWDLDTGRSLGTIPSRSPVAVRSDPSGSDVVVGEDAGLQMWDLSIERLLREACAVANRELTAEEWRFYIGGERRRTCAGRGPGS